MESKYLSFEEFIKDFPGFTQQHYDALLQDQFVLRLGYDNDRVTIHPTLYHSGKAIPKGEKRFEVLGRSDLRRRLLAVSANPIRVGESYPCQRILAVSTFDSDESPTVLASVALFKSEWSLELMQVKFIVDTGATNTIIRVSEEEYKKIEQTPKPIGDAAGVFYGKKVTCRLTFGEQGYSKDVIVSHECENNLLGMDLIGRFCLVMMNGRMTLCESVPV
jgi:predicted aspartyl protease